MARALIIGAGAIGRGYLPWELKDLIIDFYDTNEALIDSLNKNKTFTVILTILTLQNMISLLFVLAQEI